MGYRYSPGSSKPMTQVEIAWLAGIIDGEGWISYQESGNSRSTKLCVESTDLDLLEQCQEFSGMGHIRLRPTREERRKPIWIWTVSTRKDVFRLLLAISPLLSQRRKQRILEVSNKMFLGCQ